MVHAHGKALRRIAPTLAALLGLLAAAPALRAELPTKRVLTLSLAKKIAAAALALPGATPLQGGVPILVEGKVVGAIGVSGNTPQEDEEIAKAGAAATPPAVQGATR